LSFICHADRSKTISESAKDLIGSTLSLKVFSYLNLPSFYGRYSMLVKGREKEKIDR
jgi:hypothetical protein